MALSFEPCHHFYMWVTLWATCNQWEPVKQTSFIRSYCNFNESNAIYWLLIHFYVPAQLVYKLSWVHVPISPITQQPWMSWGGKLSYKNVLHFVGVAQVHVYPSQVSRQLYQPCSTFTGLISSTFSYCWYNMICQLNNKPDKSQVGVWGWTP